MNRILWMSCLALLAGVEALGHGRNSTVIRADIGRSSGVVRIEAVLADLLVLAGRETGDWQKLDEGERDRMVQAGAEHLLKSFVIIQDTLQVLESSGNVIYSIRKGVHGDGLPNPDQCSIPMELRYHFPSAPQQLTIWLNFGDTESWRGFHGQVILRQEGELVMFPASLGEGILVNRSFDWSRQPEDISKSTELDFAVCDWKHRPANGLLRIEDGFARWQLYIPIARLDLDWTAMNTKDGEAAIARLLEGLYLKADGIERPWKVARKEIRKLAGHAHHTVAPGALADREEGLLELELESNLGDEPQRMEIGCTRFSDEFPVLYNAVFRSTMEPVIFTLCPARPEFVVEIQYDDPEIF